MEGYLKIIFAGWGICSILRIVVGAAVLVRRKPLLCRTIWMWWLAVLFFLAPLAMFFPVYLFESGGSSVTSIMLASIAISLIASGVIVVLWRMTSGYTVFGVTDDSFREAIQAALAVRSIAYEERPPNIHLKDQGADLQVSLPGRIGSGHVITVEAAHEEILRVIVFEMNEFFRRSTARVNLSACANDILVGVAILTLALREFYHMK